MRIYKTKEFARFARSEAVPDDRLCEAARRAERGLIDADLGGGLIKQRVARQGQGRSRGFRTLLAFRNEERAVFVYGFAKSERDNIRDDELRHWRKLAIVFLEATPAELERLIEADELMEVLDDG